MTKRYGMPTKAGKKKRSKAADEMASSISYRLRAKYGLYSDMPKAKPLDAENKPKLGAGKPR